MLIIKNPSGGGINLVTTNAQAQAQKNNGPHQDVDLWTFLGNEVYPVGTIMPYNGLLKNLPPEWKLCDGSGITPNLHHRFVWGSKSWIDTYTGGSADAVAPSHTHTIAIDKAGAHEHWFDEKKETTSWRDAHSHSQPHSPYWGDKGVCNPCGMVSRGNGNIKTGSREVWSTGNPGDHSHWFNIAKTNTDWEGVHTHTDFNVSTGKNGTGKNIPNNRKMYFIMKVR